MLQKFSHGTTDPQEGRGVKGKGGGSVMGQKREKVARVQPPNLHLNQCSSIFIFYKY